MLRRHPHGPDVGKHSINPCLATTDSGRRTRGHLPPFIGIRLDIPKNPIQLGGWIRSGTPIARVPGHGRRHSSDGTARSKPWTSRSSVCGSVAMDEARCSPAYGGSARPSCSTSSSNSPRAVATSTSTSRSERTATSPHGWRQPSDGCCCRWTPSAASASGSAEHWGCSGPSASVCRTDPS